MNKVGRAGGARRARRVKERRREMKLGKKTNP